MSRERRAWLTLALVSDWLRPWQQRFSSLGDVVVTRGIPARG